MMKCFDHHVHTGFSRCVKESYSVAAALEHATSRGFVEGIGITNHVHANSPEQSHLAITRAEIDALPPSMAGRVKLGAEVDIDHPTGKFVLSKASLDLVDYIIAGPHNQPHHSLLLPDLEDEERAEYFQSLHDIIVTSLDKNPVDIWVHPFLQEIDIGGAMFEKEMFELLPSILDVLEEKDIAMEISSTFHRDKENAATIGKYDWLEAIRVSTRVYRMAVARKGIRFSFASDAHRLDLAGDIGIPLVIARCIGIPGSRVLRMGELARHR